MSDITIVTGFFDIGRGNWKQSPDGKDLPHYIPRTTDDYFSYFENLAKMKNDMIIYCSEEHANRINDIRLDKAPGSYTKVVTAHFERAIKNIKPIIEKVQKRPEYIKLIDDPRMPEYWNPEYVLVNFMKTDFVVSAFMNKFIRTKQAAWLDFGYVRGESTLPKSLKWSYNFTPEKMHIFNKIPLDPDRPIFDIIKTNTVYIMGCHIVGNEMAWQKNQSLNGISLSSLLSCGLIDDDQTLLLMNYRRMPDIFETHFIDVKQEEWDNWNVAMIKFNEEVND